MPIFQTFMSGTDAEGKPAPYFGEYPADYFDFIVIDEVHHVTAQSYRKLLDFFQPTILVGLTATPERHDGGDILADFDNVIATEIRLPEAVNQRHHRQVLLVSVTLLVQHLKFKKN